MTNGVLSVQRYYHTTTVLQNGKVLVAGGDNNVSGPLTSAELYDPATGRWTNTGSLNVPREHHTATLLPNGKVLMAGGAGLSGFLSSAELYDPATGNWTNTASMNTARQNHSAILLPNGKVLVSGGFGSSGSSGFLSTSEVYDPATGQWASAGVLVGAREYHTTTLLPNGKILAAGGEDSSFSPVASAEIYDLGLGFNSSWQPVLTSAPSSFPLGNALMVTGTKFRGISGGSGGSAQDASADYPLLQLRSLQTDKFFFIPPASWTSNSFTSVPVSGLPLGHALATIFVNGIPGSSVIVRIDTPAILVQGTRLSNGAFQLNITNAPGTAFTALSSSNLTLPLGSWGVLGSIPEITPGQFQFTDTLATNQPRRFYRVRSP